MRIAYLEDDKTQADLVIGWLSDAGHDVKHYTESVPFLQDCGKESFDFFLLDWMLPDISGDEVLVIMRQEKRLDTPVLFTSHRHDEDDVVAVLQKGADDYMIKPIRHKEMLARIEAIYRRAHSLLSNEAVMSYGPYEIDTVKRSISINGVPVELTGKEFDLSVFLFRNLGRLISRGHILETIWNKNTSVMTRTLDTHMSRIRSKLNLRAENDFRLIPIYNYGYRLERVD